MKSILTIRGAKHSIYSNKKAVELVEKGKFSYKGVEFTFNPKYISVNYYGDVYSQSFQQKFRIRDNNDPYVVASKVINVAMCWIDTEIVRSQRAKELDETTSEGKMGDHCKFMEAVEKQEEIFGESSFQDMNLERIDQWYDWVQNYKKANGLAWIYFWILACKETEFLHDVGRVKQLTKKPMNDTVKNLIVELEAAITELYKAGMDGIAYVGSANYPEREREARLNVRDCQQKVDFIMEKLKKELETQ